MSSAGSNADSKLLLQKRLRGREFSQDVSGEILKHLVKRVKSELPQDAIEEDILPYDMVREILKRLPVRSLFQYRCICKSWQMIIDDSYFMDLHLKHSALHASNWHLASIKWCYPPRSLCFLFSGESLSMSKMEIPFGPPYSHYVLVGSCNGLMCVVERSQKGYGGSKNYGQSMYLWNLFTRKHKDVQPRLEGESFFIRTSIGFGFHPKSKDYKILMIVHYPKDYSLRNIGKKKWCGVKIYSLKTNSWRCFKCEVPAFWDSTVPTICLNGNMHWFVPKRRPKSIVFFDLTKEVFNEMALSEELSCIVSDSEVVALLVLNDMLAVCTVSKEGAAFVWVMKEYRRPESWRPVYSFSVDGQVTGFDGFMMNGELLMVIDDARVFWNPVNRRFRYDSNDSLEDQSNLVTLIESFVSP